MAKSFSTTVLFRLAAAGVCLGLAATALLYDLPLRVLFWDEKWWSWFASIVGYSWKEWVTSTAIDEWIVGLIKGMGAVLALCGILTLARKGPAMAAWVAFIILLIQHFLQYKSHFWQLGQLLELALQTAAPMVFLYWTKKWGQANTLSATDELKQRLQFWFMVRLLIAVTFIGHGLYAVGFHPVPANFIVMTQAGVGVAESVARDLLLMVGVLDFLAAALLLLPNRKSQLIALGWIIPWAILTSLARLWSYGGLVTLDTLFWQWLPEVVRRLPHVLVPLAFWRALRGASN